MELPYYREDLALIHHLGFGFHADACAPGILHLLEGVGQRDGLVVEVGCGSGLLTAYLVDARLRVIATDASDAMLNLARSNVPGPAEIRRLTLPEDPIPRADAIVGVGHALNYLDEESQVEAALVAIAVALTPGGIIAIDLCDLEWGAIRVNRPPQVWRAEDWALITEPAVPEPNRYVRVMTTFVKQGPTRKAGRPRASLPPFGRGGGRGRRRLGPGAPRGCTTVSVHNASVTPRQRARALAIVMIPGALLCASCGTGPATMSGGDVIASLPYLHVVVPPQGSADATPYLSDPAGRQVLLRGAAVVGMEDVAYPNADGGPARLPGQSQRL